MMRTLNDVAAVGARCAVLALLAAVTPGFAQAPAAAPSPTGAPAELRGEPAAGSPPRARPPALALDAIRRAGVLRVGVVSIPPWAMPAASGELIGFEIDVGMQLARDLGVRAEFVRTSLGSYAGDLAAGRFDVAAAGLWPTPAQALLVNFSRPYASNSIELIANSGKAQGRSRDDFDRPAVAIGVRRGSHSEAAARRHFPKARITTFDADEPMFSALIDGRAAAVVVASPVAEFLETAYQKILVKPLPQPLATRREAFAVMRGDPDLLAFLDAWILYQEDTGWLDERRKYWFRSFQWVPKL